MQHLFISDLAVLDAKVVLVVSQISNTTSIYFSHIQNYLMCPSGIVCLTALLNHVCISCSDVTYLVALEVLVVSKLSNINVC